MSEVSDRSDGEDVDKGITVLVIEDRAVVRQATAELLRGEGYGVVEAADGIEGLQHLRAKPVDVDVVLLDLHMPRVDGAGVLAALDDPPPVIVHSAYDYGEEDSIRSRFGSKVCAFLQKPAAPQVLLDVVSNVATRGTTQH